ncbi:MAG: hypothetical protein D6730_21275 [Bacteroidetes bacterium]|nr:MAG: hypothetical protein D6730_21275 [Bacteroidota bacterium]
MKRHPWLLFALLLACSGPRHTASLHFTVLEHVQLIDVEGRALLPDQTVVLADSLIGFVGREWRPPAGARLKRIDGQGGYLLPGLWDMHAHLCWESHNDSLLFPPFLANGITSVRDMGGELSILRAFRAASMPHPTLLGAGPMLDGNPPVMHDFSIPLDAHSPVFRLLDSLLEHGADFFKTYSLIREPELAQIAAYARQKKRFFCGHLSEYVEPEQAIALGQKSIEHLNRLDDIWQHQPQRMEKLAAQMHRAGTWLCPTLVVYHHKMLLRDSSIIRPDYEQYIHPVLATEWARSREATPARSDTAYWQQKALAFERALALVYELHRQGVGILAGSDFGGMPFVYPGIGLLEELLLLRQAGLVEMEVLRSATLNPATFFGLQGRMGSVKEGKLAALLLLRQNPLEDIRNLSSTEMVFVKGKLVYHDTNP